MGKIIKGLMAVKSHRSTETAPQEFLDTFLVKPSEKEVNDLVESLYSKEPFERTPGIYAQSYGTYIYNKLKNRDSRWRKPIAEARAAREAAAKAEAEKAKSDGVN